MKRVNNYYDVIIHHKNKQNTHTHTHIVDVFTNVIHIMLRQELLIEVTLKMNNVDL